MLLRTGYVLTPDSLASQVAQFRRHLGGWIGTGRGWTPWIHIADEVGHHRLRAASSPGSTGRSTSPRPTPVRAREFARVLGRTVGRRAWLPVPTPFVRMGLGVITDILVRGKRVIPARASELGYRFRFPVLDLALHDLLGQPDDDVRGGAVMRTPAVTAEPGQASQAGRLLAVNFAACLLLLIQYLLGMAVNLYVVIPGRHPGAGAQQLLRWRWHRASPG